MKRAFILVILVILLFSVACAENVTQWDYELTTSDYTLSGQYTGEIKNGLPDGYGVFETITPSGVACHYLGEWKNGLMQGNGAMYWDDGSVEIGKYDRGLFTVGKYNYNGLELITADADGEGTLNPHWLRKITKTSMTMDDEPTVIYIGNKNSHVFHYPDCDSVRTMKEKNKVELYSREEAIEKNYKPCGRCSP